MSKKVELIRSSNMADVDHDVPSTLYGVTILGYENQRVEIEAVAAIPATASI